MLIATVKANATATAKHPSLNGRKLLICQPINQHGQPISDPILAIDILGAGPNDTVMLSSDGRGVQQLLNDKTTPVRWFTLGLIDPNQINTTNPKPQTTKPAA